MHERPEVMVMGIVLILLGLAAAGIVVDYAIENGLATGPDQTFQLLDGTFTAKSTEIVVAAAVLGALAVLLVVVGIGLARGSWGRRRGLRRRVRDLEHENAALRSRAHLAEVVRIEPAEEATPLPTEGSGTPPIQPDDHPNPVTRR
jgi:hypothetical protein